jgi:propanol-preferring alcohol dehydrogenase
MDPDCSFRRRVVLMKAVQLHQWQSPPRLVDVPEPHAGPGQVVIDVAGAGVCHSDLHILDWPPGTLDFDLPFTLGHEATGRIAEMGPGVTGLAVGDAVAVYGPWGCGVCRNCSTGMENYCLRAAEIRGMGPGLGRDGAMAKRMLVPSPRWLVPIGKLDPVRAAPLTDAGLTPYHAIKRSLSKLVPGSSTVVIGVGGLGHMAVQILRAVSATQIVAVDVCDEKLEHARALGAHVIVRAGDGAAKRIREATGGADVVLDIVGSEASLALAAAVAAARSDVAIVGLAGGKMPIGFGTVPFECAACVPYWGSRDELHEVIALAQRGAISVEVQTFPLSAFAEVYERLRQGAIKGRAVLVP